MARAHEPQGDAPRPMLTINEAAAAAGVSRDTIKRRHRDGAFPGAERAPGGAWRIPAAELLAAGFRLHAPAPPDEPQGDAPPADVAELERLRSRVAELERRVAVAEAIAEERLRAVTLAELAMRALPPASEQPQGDAPRRRWRR